jgi:ATP-dependent DNA helicase HFM1/MER3
MSLTTTQTLAVGVNLPAHTVIIKGTQTWSGPVDGFREYSDIEIQVRLIERPQLPCTDMACSK